MKLVTKERKLVGWELALVIGKKGATISELVTKHKLSADIEKIDKENGVAFLTGPPNFVDSALEDIENMIKACSVCLALRK